MILLDTNIVIDFFNGNPAVAEEIKQNIDKIALSTLVVAELDYGAKASAKSKANLEKLYRFIEVIQVLPFDLKCGKQFGSIKSKLRKIGKPTGEMDALIAATALAYKATLVTGNSRHFENIEGLNLENWSKQS
jgi:tRNA(fMet)-specific endonuclease VapC